MKGRHLRLLLVVVLSATATAADRVRSGYDYLQPETRAMQDDDFSNPGMVTVEQGAELFGQPGRSGRTCADCHGGNGSRLSPARIARYPVYSKTLGKPLTLRNRVRLCWQEWLGNPPLPYAAAEGVALETFVRHLARGEPVDVDISGPMRRHYENGRKLYYTRFGQIDVACNHCHDDHAGQHFRGQVLTQGQTNGFPEYRLAKGEITGLHKRLTQCMKKFRARPFAPGSDEYTDLEVYLAARGNGLRIETPAVRY
ncbi:MAG TPA: sulfur oxidation c-type cytochrome SoxA [Gammaproteobacteria bacterium]|nr:sulfur oxidation c-type cytochrome SoxA [Gammaproteobacteria bacterium]